MKRTPFATTLLVALSMSCGGENVGPDAGGLDASHADAAADASDPTAPDASNDAMVIPGPCRPDEFGEFPAIAACDDGDPCTWDVCIGGPDGGCTHTRHESLCQGYASLSAATYGGCAIATDGSVWCWHLYDGESHVDVPTRIEGVDGALKVRVGGGAIQYTETEWPGICEYETRGSGASNACAMVEGGRLFCWALTDDRTVYEVRATAPVTDFGFVYDQNTVCARTDAGAMECWVLEFSTYRESVMVSFPSSVSALVPSHLTSRDCAEAYGLCAHLVDGGVECQGERGSPFSPNTGLPAAVDDFVFTGVDARILGGFVPSRGSCWLTSGQVSCTPLVSSCGAEPIMDAAENLVPIGNGFCAQTSEGVRCGVWALPNHHEEVAACRTTQLYDQAGWRISEPAPETAGAELMDGVWDFPCVRRGGTFECWNPRVGSNVRFPPWEAPFREPELVMCGLGDECLCPSSQTLCGDTAGDCMDTSSDPEHCGDCDRACPPDASCVAGTCSCPGEIGLDCGGACVDAASDDAHCGSCGSACTADEACASGRCLPVQEVRLMASEIYTLSHGAATWSDARIGWTTALSTTGAGAVAGWYGVYWDSYTVRRMGLRFAVPTLPVGATIIGGELVITPSDTTDAYQLGSVGAVSFTPRFPPGVTDTDFDATLWGSAAVGTLSTSGLTPGTSYTMALDSSLAGIIPSSGSFWFLGLRTGDDISGRSPPSAEFTRGGPYPRVAVDAAADVELAVHYVVP